MLHPDGGVNVGGGTASRTAFVGAAAMERSTTFAQASTSNGGWYCWNRLPCSRTWRPSQFCSSPDNLLMSALLDRARGSAFQTVELLALLAPPLASYLRDAHAAPADFCISCPHSLAVETRCADWLSLATSQAVLRALFLAPKWSPEN